MKFAMIDGVEYIYCSKCDAPINFRANTYTVEGSIKCMDCDSIIGYVWDPEIKDILNSEEVE